MSERNTAHWNSQTGFIIACIGAAVGLGNIWKFPYMTGTQGGGAFVLIYLISIFAIAIPIAAAELVVGKRGQQDATRSVASLAQEAGQPRALGIIGSIGILGAFVLLTFYAVIAGWVSHYLLQSLSGAMSGLDATATDALFSQLLANPLTMISHQAIFLALVGVVLVRQLNSGLERANVVMIPALIVMLLVIVAYGANAGDIGAAWQFLFTPDLSKINPEVVQSAVGHGFFSVGVGAAMLITYGAYLNKSVDIAKAAITIGIADTLIALMAGLGIFAIVFGEGLEPAAGPGLIFQTLPLAFAKLPFGDILAVIFFTLVYFAALTSALSLGEAVIKRAESLLSLKRFWAAVLSLGAIFIVGLASVFSFNLWADLRLPLPGAFGEKNIFDAKDYLVTAYLMPLGGLGVVAFASWLVPVDKIRTTMASTGWLFVSWLWAARVIAPIGIIWMIIAAI